MRQVSARVTYLADPFVRTLAALSASDAAIATCDAARLVGPVLVLAVRAVGAGTILQRIDEAARSTVGAKACKRLPTRLPLACWTLRAIDAAR